MTSVYEKNIVEIRNEYITRLIQIVAPRIYEGVESMYEKACVMQKKVEQINATRKPLESGEVKTVTPTITEVFEKVLADVKNWNNDIIEKETNRIRCFGNYSEWFDKLIKATVKSNITLLTSGYSFKNERVAFKNLHNKVDSNKFIHTCYICASDRICNESYLFSKTNFSDREQHENKRMAMKHIESSVSDAVWNNLPVSDILGEYVDIEPIVEQPISMTKIADNNIQKQLNDTETKRQSPGLNKITAPSNNNLVQMVDKPSTYQEPKQQMSVDIPSDTQRTQSGGKSRSETENDSDSEDEVSNAVINHITKRKDTVKKQSTQNVETESVAELENYNNAIAYKTRT